MPTLIKLDDHLTSGGGRPGAPEDDISRDGAYRGDRSGRGKMPSLPLLVERSRGLEARHGRAGILQLPDRRQGPPPFPRHRRCMPSLLTGRDELMQKPFSYSGRLVSWNRHGTFAHAPRRPDPSPRLPFAQASRSDAPARPCRRDHHAPISPRAGLCRSPARGRQAQAPAAMLRLLGRRGDDLPRGTQREVLRPTGNAAPRRFLALGGVA